MRWVLAFSLFIVAHSKAIASPWIGTVDPQLHQDLVTLTEFRVLNSVVNTYPVPWSGIASQLRDVEQDNLPTHAKLALQRLRHYLAIQHRQRSATFVELYGASEEARFTAFNGEQRESARASVIQQYQQRHFSAQISLNYETGGDVNFDQSFIAYQLAGWNLSVGALDQWWGPATSTSLILTDNARPVPSVGISRATTAPSESKWLHWIGPWYFTAQLGQMESSRSVPDTRLWRTRFTFQPIEGLELGAAWTAMWGGEGRPSSFSDFIDVLTFQNICANGASTCDPALNTKQGNHIAGFDLKYNFLIYGTPISLYAQRVGEDSIDTYRVTDNANLFGVSAHIFNARWYFEGSDTNVACGNDGSSVKDCYYESGQYPDGYRRYDRALGSTFDSDARQFAVGVQFSPSVSSTAQIQLSRLSLNPDGTRPSPVLRESAQEKLWYLNGHYQDSWRDWQVKVGLNVALREFERDELDDKTDVSGYVHLRYLFD